MVPSLETRREFLILLKIIRFYLSLPLFIVSFSPPLVKFQYKPQGISFGLTSEVHSLICVNYGLNTLIYLEPNKRTDYFVVIWINIKYLLNMVNFSEVS